MGDNKKLLADIKEIAEALNITADYALNMQVVTKYKPSSAPNMINVMRLINRIKKEYKI
ncbi:hypothetical protein [Clostridium estertheticum]|uniref:hypothetical protein n=1 Tax=Clostridium estertheticum TaxID=238834 RepID=UPI00129CDD72|nr:hypothetical protein [Clostridium estertheticum]